MNDGIKMALQAILTDLITGGTVKDALEEIDNLLLFPEKDLKNIEILNGAKEGFQCMCNNQGTFYKLKVPDGSNRDELIICDWCGRDSFEEDLRDPEGWMKRKYKEHCWICKGKGEIFIDLGVQSKAKESYIWGGSGSIGSFMLCKKCAKKMVLPVKFASHVFREDENTKDTKQGTLECF